MIKVASTSHSKVDSRYYCSDMIFANVLTRISELGSMVGVNVLDIDGVLVELEEDADDKMVIFTLKHELGHKRDQVWRSICRLYS